MIEWTRHASMGPQPNARTCNTTKVRIERNSSGVRVSQSTLHPLPLPFQPQTLPLSTPTLTFPFSFPGHLGGVDHDIGQVLARLVAPLAGVFAAPPRLYLTGLGYTAQLRNNVAYKSLDNKDALHINH